MSLLASLGLLEIFGISWLVDAFITPISASFSHGILPGCVTVSKFPLKTPVIGLGPILMTLFKLDSITK